ncbi:putative pre-mRNA-splicing factor ATP-dependent RNA helicase DHX32 [Galemys pyrenaicus]|uniref:Putative pre-mRNA-splicing factor ATP-dependent RNA helicase DHX32 n=1 Tax=Galemys pyrenaicus TaxID=202257 RepID=A0A8J6AES1_GALPY|nr:putative pre-mRNA-splicing factor ATP-dependent RNA helicase DHX32 [Galemys pyrenaicus]
MGPVLSVVWGISVCGPALGRGTQEGGLQSRQRGPAPWVQLDRDWSSRRLRGEARVGQSAGHGLCTRGPGPLAAAVWEGCSEARPYPGCMSEDPEKPACADGPAAQSFAVTTKPLTQKLPEPGAVSSPKSSAEPASLSSACFLSSPLKGRRLRDVAAWDCLLALRRWRPTGCGREHRRRQRRAKASPGGPSEAAVFGGAERAGRRVGLLRLTESHQAAGAPLGTSSVSCFGAARRAPPGAQTRLASQRRGRRLRPAGTPGSRGARWPLTLQLEQLRCVSRPDAAQWAGLSQETRWRGVVRSFLCCGDTLWGRAGVGQWTLSHRRRRCQGSPRGRGRSGETSNLRSLETGPPEACARDSDAVRVTERTHWQGRVPCVRSLPDKMEEAVLERSNASPEKRYFPESLDSSDGEEDGALACEDLELNPFDGLPYSSRYYKLLKEREELPIWKEKYSFMESLLQNQVVIISGDAKCGKSSQVPQWCAEYCLSVHYQHGGVVCTQVHKQTAVQLALRVADEMDVNIGHEVGYVIPFENCCTSETILRYCTADMLQREMMSNPFLGGYGVVVLDDVQERRMATDVLLGLLKAVLLARPELRLVVSSAPRLLGRLRAHCGGAPVVEVRRAHAVEVVHLGGAQEPLECVPRLVLEIQRSGEPGDIVIFLACEQDIEKAYEAVCQEGAHMHPEAGGLAVIPLYPREKNALLRPQDDAEERWQGAPRRVVLTASSGETLICNKSVRFVIDVGVERREVYNPRIRANSLLLQPISQSQAETRKQILGSSASGKLFCLYSEEFASKDMQPLKPAEVQEANLTSMVLFLKRVDIAGLGHCDFITRPAPESLMQALEDLDYLAALDDDGNLSELGVVMSEFPLDPQLSKSILASCEFDCVDEMLTIAAMVTAPSCFVRLPPGAEEAALTCWKTFLHPDGDHFTLINIYKAYQDTALRSSSEHCVEKWCHDCFLSCAALRTADAIRAELLEIIRRIELPYAEPAFGSEENTLNVKKALLSGHFLQIARDVDGSGNYLMLTHKQVAQLHPLCGYSLAKKTPEWVLFHRFSISENNYIRVTSEISPELFVQLAPQYYFSNLPPSESKDILQQAMDHLASLSAVSTEHKAGQQGPEAAEQRCVLQ